MYIKNLNIENFRGIKKGAIQFQKGMNILIGPGNIGKSTILKAIEFVLNPYIPWWQNSALNELDFFNGNIEEPINIEIILGCDRKNCCGDDACSRFEIETSEGSKTCRLSSYTLPYDKRDGKILKAEDIQAGQELELTIKIKMTANFLKKDGYVETKFLVLNEDGEEWHELSRSMKEWIGCVILDAGRAPEIECAMQSRSFLSKAVGNINEWKYKYLKDFKEGLKNNVQELVKGEAKPVFRLIKEKTNEISPYFIGEISATLEGTSKNDLLRQIELSFKSGEGAEIPISRQGRGLQNIISIILGTQLKTFTATPTPPPSIFLLEEPEQNLEPQLQRSLIQTVHGICGQGEQTNQIILTTHSPHVLSSKLDLDGIVKLQGEDGEIKSIVLKSIAANENKKRFFEIRKLGGMDSELFEALFSRLVVLWEGDCEAGFYPALMRITRNYPSELLFGLMGGGDQTCNIAEWYTNAGYKVIAVLDGDKDAPLRKFKEKKIPFIALPQRKKMEHIISAELSKLEEKDMAYVFLSSIGARGSVNWRSEYDGWKFISKIFEKGNAKGQPLETDSALRLIDSAFEEIKDSSNKPNMEFLRTLLTKNKNRRVYETFAHTLHEKNAIPGISKKIMEHLKDIWFGRISPGQFQFTDGGDIEPYKLVEES